MHDFPSLAVKELPQRDARGRRVAVQRYQGNGPIRSGDVFAVLVDVPREPVNGRRLVDVVTAGYVECVTPARGHTRGTWTLRPAMETGEPWTTDTTRDAAALTLADTIPSVEETKAAELAAAAGRGDRAALDRINAAHDTARAEQAADAAEAADTAATIGELVDAFRFALDAAAQAERVHDAQTEWAARLEADRIAAALDALGACPCRLPRDHPRGLVFCTEHGATGAPSAPVTGTTAGTAAAELVTLADTMQAAREREEAAEARHTAADAAVLAARAALAEAEEERRAAREEMAAAAGAADALWQV